MDKSNWYHFGFLSEWAKLEYKINYNTLIIIVNNCVKRNGRLDSGDIVEIIDSLTGTNELQGKFIKIYVKLIYKKGGIKYEPKH